MVGWLAAIVATTILGEVLAFPTFVVDAAQFMASRVLHLGVDLLFHLGGAKRAGLGDTATFLLHEHIISQIVGGRK